MKQLCDKCRKEESKFELEVPLVKKYYLCKSCFQVNIKMWILVVMPNFTDELIIRKIKVS